MLLWKAQEAEVHFLVQIHVSLSVLKKHAVYPMSSQELRVVGSSRSGVDCWCVSR